MNIKLAESAGFCFGVKRAVEIVENQIAKGSDKKIYTYGPIIHNEIVVSEFEENGVSVIEEDGDLSKLSFLTAMKNPEDIPEMLHEMATVGVSMAIVVTAVWGIAELIAHLINKKQEKITLQGAI